MMKKNICVITLLLLFSCSKENKATSELQPKDSVAPVSADSLRNKNTNAEPLSREESMKILNNKIISTLRSKDFESFSNYIHPEKGIIFSMYAFVNPKKDKHFSREDFDSFLPKDTKFTWGELDGTGDLLVLPIKKYLTEWVFKRNYKDAEFYFNEFKGKGNTINNIKENYPNALITENYIPGTEIYSGMDWNSLIFVFEEYNGKYYLVAVANNSWTT